MSEFLALYVSLITIVGLQLACAYPSIPEGQSQCIVEWYPKNDRPLYGKTQRLTGPCESFNVECSYGITLPLNVPEGLGFLGKVIQGCADQYKLAVPCCLPDIKCGTNLEGRCMNRNKKCNGDAWFSDERCPEGPWSCCEPNYATTGIDGEDTQMVASEAGFTIEETGGTTDKAAGTDRAFTPQEMYQPVSWDDLAAVPFISELDDSRLETNSKLLIEVGIVTRTNWDRDHKSFYHLRSPNSAA